MKTIPNYPYCFVCGDKNKIGLKVAFFYENGKAKAQYTPTPEFEGYKDILHGGILSALLDEVMIYSIIAQGIITVTIQMEVKFKKPAKIGETLFLEGQVTEDKGKILLTQGKALNQDGTIIAEAKGKFFRAEGEMKKDIENYRL
ncbi:MAG: PaaI family thioesterase [Candidatus Aminicenantes bacterium]|nr:MAG: PaaI family thioesterase [Candidatus Aminicenantes bacterium]